MAQTKAFLLDVAVFPSSKPALAKRAEPVQIDRQKEACSPIVLRTMETGLMLERLAQTIALSTADRKEGTSAFLEKRPAKFQGR